MKTDKLKLLSSASLTALVLSMGSVASAQSQGSASSDSTAQPDTPSAEARAEAARRDPDTSQQRSGSTNPEARTAERGTPPQTSVSPQAGAAALEAVRGDTTKEKSTSWSTEDLARSSSWTDSENPAHATAASPDSKSSQAGLRIASEDEAKRTLDKLDGKLQTHSGQDVGSIKDFLVDAQSGEIKFAVVSSGGVLGIGSKLHLVPFQELSLRADDKGFATNLTREQLEKARTVTDDALESGRVSASQSQEAGQEAQAAGTLVRASKLKGKDVRSNDREIGEIAGIGLSTDGQHASAIVKVEDDVDNNEAKYLVPLNQLSIDAEVRQVTTQLTAADFRAGTSVTAIASADRRANTGRTFETQGSNTAASPVVTLPDHMQSSQGTVATAESGAQTQSSQSSGSSAITLPDHMQTGSQGAVATAESSTQTQSSQRSDSSADTETAAQPIGGDRDNVASSSGSAGSTTVQSGGSQTSESVASTTGSSVPVIGDDSGFAAPTGSTSTEREDVRRSEQFATADTAASQQGQQPGAADTSTQTPGLSPTGQTSADQNPSADASLLTAARQIREALDADPELARADVQVSPEQNRIVLRGHATSDTQKQSIEAKARDAAKGANLDLQIEVKDQ